MVIYLDMDGTIADLYDYPNWLQSIYDGNVDPYAYCASMVNIEELNNAITKANSNGIEVSVLSWNFAAELPQDTFNAIEDAKRFWLRKYNIKVNNVVILPYGVPKYSVAANDDILIDDDKNNVDEWNENLNGAALVAADVCKQIIDIVNKSTDI